MISTITVITIIIIPIIMLFVIALGVWRLGNITRDALNQHIRALEGIYEKLNDIEKALKTDTSHPPAREDGSV